MMLKPHDVADWTLGGGLLAWGASQALDFFEQDQLWVFLIVLAFALLAQERARRKTWRQNDERADPRA